MLCSRVNFEFPKAAVPELVARKHALHGKPQHEFGLVPLEIPIGNPTDVADETGMPEMDFVAVLFASELDFSGIDNHDEIAHVEIGLITGLVFPAKDVGDLSRQTAKNLVLGIDYEPIMLDLAFAWYERLHRMFLLSVST